MVVAQEPLCVECLASGLADRATAEVDHIIPISEAPHLRLTRENLQGLCSVCHGRKTRAEGGQGEMTQYQRDKRIATVGVVALQ